MSSPTNERRLKKQKRVLDLNESPPMVISNEKDQHTFRENVFPANSCSNGLKSSFNMVEEALATIPLSFKRQEASQSILVIQKGILTLVQDQRGQHDDRPQEMHKKGLRTSWTVHHVDGHFELPNECVNYILLRDKCRQRLSRFTSRRLPNVDTRSGHHLTIYNRLEGWRVETRKRPAKTHDKFYHHRSSGRMFRSLVEVEKFIKYEMYPPKPRRLSKNTITSL